MNIERVLIRLCRSSSLLRIRNGVGGELFYKIKSTAPASRLQIQNPSIEIPDEKSSRTDENAKKDENNNQESNQSKSNENQSRSYKDYWRWSSAPLFIFLAYAQYRRLPTLEPPPPRPVQHLEITCYRMLPLNAFSRSWGWVNNIDLPNWARTPFLSWYARTFGCKIEEAEVEDLCHYKNLGEFFRRSLKDGLRPVSQSTSIVSPADGRVLHFGKVEKGGGIEQVKGVTYSLSSFLGPQYWSRRYYSSQGDNNQYHSALLSNPVQNSLYTCVVYLAPGDYHRFHSPANWTVQFRRHFSGELLSVNPRMANWISGLFHLNERAVYLGSWKHGFFSMSAIGATNVGSIRVYPDKGLSTNRWGVKRSTFHDYEFQEPLQLHKGDPFGEFNLGSTIVLIFEAPSNAEFSLAQGSKIKMGEPLFQTEEIPKQKTEAQQQQQ